ncbi:DUF2066 domain-containing protein [Aliidiomarina celeris]|uniref:DUF2066 domain-containing protein n=1 Tax=Aliidiomarina celeris TaxID=2249428 RepID=UPI0018E65E9C|nr:DUF2066 domain-containing protein [Aliidiomarina celeris]
MAQENSERESAMARLLQANVPVESQARSERDRATRAGFAEVLVRLSGHTETLEREGVAGALRNANDYVIQFSYRSEQGQRYLQVSFNEERTLGLLQQAQASIWSARRPELMVWIAQATNSGLEFVGQDTDPEFVAALSEQGTKRGLVLNTPLLDLTDRMVLSANDVWGRFEAPVLEANRRYPANGAVMVRLIPSVTATPLVEEGMLQTESMAVEASPMPSRAEWTVVIGEFRSSGEVSAPTESELAVALANQITEQVAREYAVSFAQSANQYVDIRILNVDSLQKVVAVEQLLQDLGPVLKVTMVRYHQGTSEFSLYVAGGAERVAQALELERRLQRIQDPWSMRETDILEYRWLR